MESFKIIYERYKLPIFNFLLRYMHERQSAEDCTQDVFIHLYKKVDRYRPTGKFSTWLYQMSRNMAIDTLRKKKVRRAVSLDAPLSDQEGSAALKDIISNSDILPDKAASSREIQELLNRGISKLDQKDKEVILLCDIQGLSHEDAAQIFGCKAPSVAVRLFRARKRLAVILGLKEDLLD